MVGITSLRRLAEALRGTPVSKSRPTHRFQTCERKSAWGTPERVPLFMLCPIVGHGDLHVKKGRQQEGWRSSFGLLLGGSCYVCQKLTGPPFVDTHFFRLSLYGIATRDSRGFLNGRVEWPLRETVTFGLPLGCYAFCRGEPIFAGARPLCRKWPQKGKLACPGLTYAPFAHNSRATKSVTPVCSFFFLGGRGRNGGQKGGQPLRLEMHYSK